MEGLRHIPLIDWDVERSLFFLSCSTELLIKWKSKDVSKCSADQRMAIHAFLVLPRR